MAWNGKLQVCRARVAAAEVALSDVRKALNDMCCNGYAEGPPFSDTNGFSTPSSRTRLPDDAIPCIGSPKYSRELKCNLTPNEKSLAQEPNKESVMDDKANQIADSVVYEVLQAQARAEAAAQEEGLFGMQKSVSWVTQQARTCSERLVIHPDSLRLCLWQCLGAILLIYLLFALPFFAAFNCLPTGIFFGIAMFSDVYFIVDVPVNFFIAYYDEDQSDWVCEPARTARRYLLTWFLPDFVSSIPYDLIFMNFHGQIARGLRMVRFARMSRLLRLCRMMKDHEIKRAMDSLFASSPALIFLQGLLQVILLVCAITHWAACAWFSVSTAASDRPAWFDNESTETPTLSTHYLYSLYFTLTTMTTVGYGDIVAKNANEVSFVLFLLLLASVVFAGLMGMLTDLIGSLNKESNALEEKKRVLSQYIRWRCLPERLAQLLRTHLFHQWEVYRGFATFETEVMDELSPFLQKELRHHIYGKVLKSAPFLHWMCEYDACMRDLANRTWSAFLSTGDYVCRAGAPIEEVSILVEGSVLMTLNRSLYSAALEDRMGTKPWKGAIIAVEFLKRLQRASASATRSTSFSLGSGGPESSALDAAIHKLREEDERTQTAAHFIQRRWRTRRLQRPPGSCTSQRKSPRRLERFRSTTIEAPSFFGESCLWEPLEDWTSPSSVCFAYSARCETRSELIQVPRDAVREVIDQYSPSLRERFEFFRQSIVEENKPSQRRGESRDQGSNDDSPRNAVMFRVPSVPMERPLYLSMENTFPKFLSEPLVSK